MAPTSTRKRPARSQPGPPPKRRRSDPDTHQNPPTKPSKQASQPTHKKRAVPVTKAQTTASDSNEEDDEGLGPDLAHEMVSGDAPSRLKNTNAAKESHKVQKELYTQRKAAKPNAEVIEQAKRVWADARKLNISKEERKKYITQLLDVIRGKVQEVVFKHDASRIIQTLVKYGGQAERDLVASELRGKFKELAQNKYSKFLVTKLIRYCPTHRGAILAELHGHVLRLLLHKEATRVVADAYELYANATQRALLLRDFYGKEVALFEPKVDGPSGLKELLDGAEREKRKRILGALKENLALIFDNPDKGAVSHAIVHRGLYEYLLELRSLPSEEEREKARREVFENCQELLAEMVHTKDGSFCVREFLVWGSAKDRKQILKVLKPHLERIWTNEEGQLVLFTALDVIDDTKLLAKSLLADLSTTFFTPKLYSEITGRRALLYPLVHRSSRHFTPALMSSLVSTDPIREKTSKKDEGVRRDEVRRAVSEGYLAAVVRDLEAMISDPGGSLVLGEVMLFAEGDKTDAINALLSTLSANPSIISTGHTSRVYKTLLQGGHFSQSTRRITRSPVFAPEAFASAFLAQVPQGTIREMARGDGVFVVAELIERVCAEGSEDDRSRLVEVFGKAGKEVRKEVESIQPRGWDVLIGKLETIA